MAAGGRHVLDGFFKRRRGKGVGSRGRDLIKQSPNSAGNVVAGAWLFDSAATGTSLSLGTTTGPAVLLANVTVSGGSKLISLATTTGPAVLLANLKTKARLTVGTTTGAATLLANLKTKAVLTVNTTTGPAVFSATGRVSSKLSIGTTVGPAVLLANVTVGSAGTSLSLGTTTGSATFYCAVETSALPDVVYLRVAAQDRNMGVNYTRFPIIVLLITRNMAVEVSRIPMRVQASPRLMRVA